MRARLESAETVTARPRPRVAPSDDSIAATLALQRQLGNRRTIALMRATTRLLQRAKLEVAGADRDYELRADGKLVESFKFDVHKASAVVSTFGSSLEELSDVGKQTITKDTNVGAYAMQESSNKGQGYGAATLYFAARECKAKGCPVLMAPAAVAHAVSFYEHMGMVAVTNPKFGAKHMIGNVDVVLAKSLESLKKAGHEIGP